jgi:predicted dehydrogenase
MASAVNGAPGPRARVSGSTAAFVIGRQFDDVGSFTEFENVGDTVGWIVRGDEREPGPVITGADQADFYRGVAAALGSDDPQPLMPVDPRDAVHVLAVIDAARTSSRDRRVVEVLTPGQAG